MTLEEIRSSDKTFLLASELAEVLETDPNTIRWQAHNAPEKLGFPVIVMKSRVKIPRLPFLEFITALASPGREECIDASGA